MFKLPNPPSSKAEPHELADFAELLCWDHGQASKREIVAYLGQVDDNDYNVGCDDDEDQNSDKLDEVMNEIERRASACGTGYPFRLALEGNVLRHTESSDSPRALLYRYFLMSTRLNMKEHRVQSGIDGTALLEEISAHALKAYLGCSRARALVFGTSSPGSFEEKVNCLCRELGEGAGFRSLDDTFVQANDDKLDAVAWVPFSDRLPSQLIVFGQCKTGSNWRGLVAQLQPDVFIKKWFRYPTIVNPVRALCISEAANRSTWKGTCTEAGILLDRCRLTDFCDNIEPDLLDRVRTWTVAAKATVNYSAI
jgi:hypothetical protein